MFVARRILRKNKQFTNFICTTDVNRSQSKSEKESKNVIEDKTETDEQKKKTSLSSTNVINFSDFFIQKSMFEAPKKIKSITKKKEKTQLNFFERTVQKSVQDVAKQMGGDKKKTVEDILSYLKEFEISKGSDKKLQFHEDTYVDDKKGNDLINLSYKPLNIFDPKIMEEDKTQLKLKIWDDLEAEELVYISEKSPSNYFEEMISWTNKGRLWLFPIDNDQGMEKEAEVSFTEHIFLEQYLEPWCPKKGPLRRFMELVLVGLSKNHNFTVEEKKAHIDWFKNYFEEKKKLLQELGAMGPAKEAKEITASTSE